MLTDEALCPIGLDYRTHYVPDGTPPPTLSSNLSMPLLVPASTAGEFQLQETVT